MMGTKPESVRNALSVTENSDNAAKIVETNDGLEESSTSSGANKMDTKPESLRNSPSVTENGDNAAKIVETNNGLEELSTSSIAKETSYAEFRKMLAEKFPGQKTSEDFMKDYVDILANQRNFYKMQEQNLYRTIEHLKNTARGPQNFEKLLVAARQIEFAKILLKKVKECILENESKIEKMKSRLSKPPEERWTDDEGVDEDDCSDLEESGEMVEVSEEERKKVIQMIKG